MNDWCCLAAGNVFVLPRTNARAASEAMTLGLVISPGHPAYGIGLSRIGFTDTTGR